MDLSYFYCSELLDFEYPSDWSKTRILYLPISYFRLDLRNILSARIFIFFVSLDWKQHWYFWFSLTSAALHPPTTTPTFSLIYFSWHFILFRFYTLPLHHIYFLSIFILCYYLFCIFCFRCSLFHIIFSIVLSFFRHIFFDFYSFSPFLHHHNCLCFHSISVTGCMYIFGYTNNICLPISFSVIRYLIPCIVVPFIGAVCTLENASQNVLV